MEIEFGQPFSPQFKGGGPVKRKRWHVQILGEGDRSIINVGDYYS